MTTHFTALSDLPVATLESLLKRAQFFSQSPPQDLSRILAHKVISQLFFEPSTRTKSSFEMAAKRLGAQVINFDVDNSSVKKGESLYDTLKTMESLGSDALVIRHADDRVFETLVAQIRTPLVNAGAGKLEHPSQGLLDLFTLEEEFGELAGLKVTILGDVRHSRVAGSLMLVAHRLGLEVAVAGPDEFIPSVLPQNCHRSELVPALESCDAVMCLRNQFERHVDLALSPASFHRDWGLTVERSKLLKPTAIIMHPAPINRDVEIAGALVEAPNSRIFQQMRNGVAVRMAILEYVTRGGQP